jgi:hypothetical protein
MEKYKFYKSINTEKGYEKYIRTTSERCTVILLGGTAPIIERFEKPYPVFDDEALEDCSGSEFYEKADNVRQRKLNFTSKSKKANAYKSLLVFAIFICFIGLLPSCTVKKFTQKPYILYNIYPSANCVVHQFISFSYTEGRDEYLDTAICAPGDTLLIKDYRLPFRGKRTCFIKP